MHAAYEMLTFLNLLNMFSFPSFMIEHTGSEQRIIGDNHDYHGNNGNDTGEGGTKLKTTNSLELDQADWYGNLPIHHECSKLEYLSEKGRERDSFVSSTRMESSQPILSTKERKLESLMKIKEFVKQNPECVKQSNQFGFLPLHCTLDKTRPNALVVEYLVEAFPDALYIASNEGTYVICRRHDVLSCFFFVFFLHLIHFKSYFQIICVYLINILHFMPRLYIHILLLHDLIKLRISLLTKYLIKPQISII